MDLKELDWEGLFSFPILFLVIFMLPCVKCNVQNCKMKILKWQYICRVSQKMRLWGQNENEIMCYRTPFSSGISKPLKSLRLFFLFLVFKIWSKKVQFLSPIMSVSGFRNWSIKSVSGWASRNWHVSSVSGSRIWCFMPVCFIQNLIHNFWMQSLVFLGAIWMVATCLPTLCREP